MIKQIIHVYKSGTFGFADFIRAIYTISDLAEKHGYSYKVAFNHPISVFFDIDTEPYEITVNTYDTLLKDIESKKQLIILESNYSSVVQIKKNLIQEFIKPKQFLIDCVETTITNLKIQKKNFVILHIRYGDDNSQDINIINEFIKRIKRAISIVKITNKPILILSSSSIILNKLSNFSNLLFTGNIPCHTANIESQATDYQNTLVEFYLMQHSKKIFNISGGSFGNGISGFSYWASKMFGIEFTHLE